jgi:hypothetical protein
VFFETPNTFTESTILRALTSELGDNYTKILQGGRVIMHSAVFGQLAQLSTIRSFEQSNMDVLKSGVVNTISGLPIILSDRTTISTVSGVSEYKTYIVGPGALALWYQRAVMIEFDRDILLSADVIAATVHFAPHLFGFDDQTSSVVSQDDKSIHAIVVKSR